MDLSFARKDFERLYVDTCSIIEYCSVTDPVTHITCPNHEVTVRENVPCRVSHKYNTLHPASSGDVPSIELLSKLIISPDVQVKPGSKIVVTRNGVSTSYKCSSAPARYITHQEIMMELLEGEA